MGYIKKLKINGKAYDLEVSTGTEITETELKAMLNEVMPLNGTSSGGGTNNDGTDSGNTNPDEGGDNSGSTEGGDNGGNNNTSGGTDEGGSTEGGNENTNPDEGGEDNDNTGSEVEGNVTIISHIGTELTLKYRDKNEVDHVEYLEANGQTIIDVIPRLSMVKLLTTDFSERIMSADSTGQLVYIDKTQIRFYVFEKALTIILYETDEGQYKPE